MTNETRTEREIEERTFASERDAEAYWNKIGHTWVGQMTNGRRQISNELIYTTVRTVWEKV